VNLLELNIDQATDLFATGLSKREIKAVLEPVEAQTAFIPNPRQLCRWWALCRNYPLDIVRI